MTAVAWLGVAGIVALIAPAKRPDGRLQRLVGAGRLGRASGASPAARRPLRVRAGWAAAGAGLLVLAIAAFGGVALAVAAGAIAFAGWRTVRQFAGRRREDEMLAAVTAAVSTLIEELEAGSRPADALRAAAAVAPPVGEVFERAAGEAAAGGSAGSVLAAEGTTRSLGCAWGLGERSGAPLSGVLMRVAADLSARARHRRAVDVALAGPRASAGVVAALPLLGLALGAAMGADPLHFLLGTPTGTVVACAGVLLDTGGVLWMQAILRRAGAT